MFESAGTVMPVWQLHRMDPGFIYVIENHGLYKIGKTRKTVARLKAARTWLPDMNLIGIKPFWGNNIPDSVLQISNELRG